MYVCDFFLRKKACRILQSKTTETFIKSPLLFEEPPDCVGSQRGRGQCLQCVIYTFQSHQLPHFTHFQARIYKKHFVVIQCLLHYSVVGNIIVLGCQTSLTKHSTRFERTGWATHYLTFTTLCFFCVFFLLQHSRGVAGKIKLQQAC